MPTIVQLRRGTTAQNNAFTGTVGELSVDTTLNNLRLHDGSTAGGHAFTQNTTTQTLTNKTLASPIITTAITLNAQADVRFADADSSNWVAFQAPATVASNITWTLPSADATSSGYALVSDSSGTLSWAAAGATVSQDNSTNTAFNLYYATTTSGALTALKYDGSDMTFNPSTSTLACTTFSGALGGNATTATTATTATNVTVADESSDTTCFPLFATAATGDLPPKSGSNLTFNSSSGLLTATLLAGDGSALTNLPGAGVPTTITVADESSDTTCFPLFTTAVTGDLAPKTGSNLAFNSSSGVLTATGFAGPITGAVTGNADTATVGTTVTLTATNTTDATHYPTFVDTATGNEDVRTDTGYTYNPSSGTLTSTIFAGTANAAKYADMAENYLPDTNYPIGTVVMIGGVNEITYCYVDAIPAGVISENPAYLMNSEQEGGLPVALVGRVKVRVVGKVQQGQLMRVDLNGVASATADGAPVGIAIEESDDVGEKLIECLLKV
jgi:hypothetical protein